MPSQSEDAPSFRPGRCRDNLAMLAMAHPMTRRVNVRSRSLAGGFGLRFLKVQEKWGNVGQILVLAKFDGGVVGV